MRSTLMRVLAVGGLLLGLSGCPSGGDLCKVRVGASRHEVIHKLGRPAWSSASNNVELFRYELLTAQSNNNSSGNAAAQVESYYVRIVDGSVVSYGKWSDLPTDQPAHK